MHDLEDVNLNFTLSPIGDAVSEGERTTILFPFRTFFCSFFFSLNVCHRCFSDVAGTPGDPAHANYNGKYVYISTVRK